MLRLLTLAVSLAATLSVSSGATLERLSLDEMIQKSTEIVRGRMVGSRSLTSGPVIYTSYQIEILERWKGAPASQIEIVVPGGVAGRLRQVFSGTPSLADGGEYVLFLWSGRNGLRHVIGLSQGFFELKQDGKGRTFAVRAATRETMLDGATGVPVGDEPLKMSLPELSSRIARTLAGGLETK